MPAVVVTRGQFHGKVRHSKFFIDADLSPDSGVAGVGSGTVLPGFGSILIRRRDGVENPKSLAGPHIEATDEALDVGLASRCSAGPVRGADDHRVAGDNRSRMKPNLTGK